MNSLQNSASVEYFIKKSRFIGFAQSCASESEVMEQLHLIYTQHQQANHLAYAYRVIDNDQVITRFNDAGEPKGTAGKPILAHIEGKDLVNTLIAVIRYFGGIKLGAGGLVRAYGTTARHVLEQCEYSPYQVMKTLRLHIDYPQLDQFKRHLKTIEGKIIAQEFGADVELVVQIPEDNCSLLENQC
ncbi:MAG: IMPACT family protein [Gammaproteobacteria bacterium]|nr:IMPACT family protein [Gammaproteobacteria bacterium]